MAGGRGACVHRIIYGFPPQLYTNYAVRVIPGHPYAQTLARVPVRRVCRLPRVSNHSQSVKLCDMWWPNKYVMLVCDMVHGRKCNTLPRIESFPSRCGQESGASLIARSPPTNGVLSLGFRHACDSRNQRLDKNAKHAARQQQNERKKKQPIRLLSASDLCAKENGASSHMRVVPTIDASKFVIIKSKKLCAGGVGTGDSEADVVVTSSSLFFRSLGTRAPWRPRLRNHEEIMLLNQLINF